MTAKERLDAALAALDRARAARGRAITDEDREATWAQFVKALADYNLCLSRWLAAGSGA